MYLGNCKRVHPRNRKGLIPKLFLGLYKDHKSCYLPTYGWHRCWTSKSPPKITPLCVEHWSKNQWCEIAG